MSANPRDLLTRPAATLPALDLERAIAFYREKLDLEPTQKNPGSIYYRTETGAEFFLFSSTGQSRSEFTQIRFEVPDVDAAVQELKTRGVEFEHYDVPGIKTDENGIADLEATRSAWFKDSEGNLLSIGTARG